MNTAIRLLILNIQYEYPAPPGRYDDTTINYSSYEGGYRTAREIRNYELKPMLMESLCCKVLFPNFSLFKRLEILSYRRYGTNGGGKTFVFKKIFSFVHAATRGGTCALTLKIVDTLIKNSARDDRPSISP